MLLLGKLEGCRRALGELRADDRRHREVLERLTTRVGAHRQMQALERELSDAEKSAGLGAPRFEAYLREYFVPFGDVLEEVRSLDGQLRATADEIAGLATDLEQARPGDAPFGPMDDRARSSGC